MELCEKLVREKLFTSLSQLG